MSGKGSAPRPFSVSDDEYANRWDAIFGRDKSPESSPTAAGTDKPKEPEPIIEGDLPQDDQDETYDDGDGDCPVCRTELYRGPTSRFLTCDVCGYSQPLERGEP